MRGSLLTIFGLLLGIQLTTANVFDGQYSSSSSSSSSSHVDRVQADQPVADTIERQVHSLLAAMKGSFGELATKRNSWYDKYDALANDAFNHTAKIIELLTISRVAMPIIWTTYEANLMRQKSEAILQQGKKIYYNPPNTHDGEPVPHPLRSLPTKLTDQDDFTIDVVLMTTAEVNVGIRLMFEPEEGHEFNWDDDDILLGVHLRWHFDWGNDREVCLNEKYDGNFIRSSETITPEGHWPAIKVGEKFAVTIQKRGPCFHVSLVHGKDMYGQEQYPFPYMHKFCPARRRTSKMVADAKRLRLIVNEDKQRTGGVEVYSMVWYPNIVV